MGRSCALDRMAYACHQPQTVIPAKAGTHHLSNVAKWVAAFARMTAEKAYPFAFAVRAAARAALAASASTTGFATGIVSVPPAASIAALAFALAPAT